MEREKIVYCFQNVLNMLQIRDFNSYNRRNLTERRYISQLLIKILEQLDLLRNVEQITIEQITIKLQGKLD